MRRLVKCFIKKLVPTPVIDDTKTMAYWGHRLPVSYRKEYFSVLSRKGLKNVGMESLDQAILKFLNHADDTNIAEWIQLYIKVRKKTNV